jgi:hypothetical protein
LFPERWTIGIVSDVIDRIKITIESACN